ncbi:Protein of unknown function DUF2321 [Candidatus Nanopelagicaceae bacterium]
MDIKNLLWPQDEAINMQRGGSYHRASAICLRGHVHSRDLDPRQDSYVPDKCTICGTSFMVACSRCNVRIAGTHVVRGSHWHMPPQENPGFCDNCGFLLPWATREQKIFELENRILLEMNDEFDREVVRSQLEKLRNLDMENPDAKGIWEKIKSKAGDALNKENVKEILSSVISKVIRESLGI